MRRREVISIAAVTGVIGLSGCIDEIDEFLNSHDYIDNVQWWNERVEIFLLEDHGTDLYSFTHEHHEAMADHRHIIRGPSPEFAGPIRINYRARIAGTTQYPTPNFRFDFWSGSTGVISHYEEVLGSDTITIPEQYRPDNVADG